MTVQLISDILTIMVRSIYVDSDNTFNILTMKINSFALLFILPNIHNKTFQICFYKDADCDGIVRLKVVSNNQKFT